MALKTHKEVKHDDITYSCKKCEFKTKYKTLFNMHVDENHNEGGSKGSKHECSDCDFKTGYRKSLEKHAYEKHGKLLNYFSCKYCPCRTRFKQTLNIHTDVEHNDNEYACTLCNFSSGPKRYIELHMQRNHGDSLNSFIERKALPSSRIKCDKCEYESKSSAALKKHKHKMHEKGKNICCDYCQFKCRTEE